MAVQGVAAAAVAVRAGAAVASRAAGATYGAVRTTVVAAGRRRRRSRRRGGRSRRIVALLVFAITASPAVIGAVAVAHAVDTVRAQAASLTQVMGAAAGLRAATSASTACPRAPTEMARRIAEVDGIADPAAIVPAFVAYCSAAAAYRLDWAVLAGIGRTECFHGTSTLPGCNADLRAADGSRLTNPQGARGPMQFLGSTWRSSAGTMDPEVAGPPVPEGGGGYATDGDGDGVADPWSWPDAAHAAARYLVALGAQEDPARAAFGYFNGGGAAFDSEHFYHRAVLAAAGSYRAAVPAVVGAGGPPGGPLGSTELVTERMITPTLRRLVDTVVPRFGRGHGVWCYRSTEDGGQHPRGRACDFIMQLPLNQMPTPQDVAHGWALSHYLVANADALHVMYVIWQGQIWSTARADEGWRTYVPKDPPGNLQSNHYDHVHVSVEWLPGDPVF